LCGCDRGLTHSGWRTCLLSPGSATYPPQTEVQILASHQSGEPLGSFKGTVHPKKEKKKKHSIMLNSPLPNQFDLVSPVEK